MRLALCCVRLVLVNYKIVNIWNDEGSRKDIVGCVRLALSCVRFLVKYKIVFVNTLLTHSV